MTRVTILFSLLLFIHLHVYSQIEEMRLVGGCALDEVVLPGTIVTDDIDELTDAAIKNILRGLGLHKTFVIRKASVKNALVTKDDKGTKLLLVNPEFMRNLKGLNSDWPVYFVLTHELGHLYNGDPLDNANHTKNMELEADKFAAVTLCKMGANIDAIKSGIQFFVKDTSSADYPTKKQRLFAVESGWADAKCSNENLTYNATTSEGEWKYVGRGYEIGYDAQNQHKYYKVCLSIKASDAELKRIDKVRYYYLHDSFGDGGAEGKIYNEITSPNHNFEVCLTIWGTFPLRVVIYYKEGKEKAIDHEWQ